MAAAAPQGLQVQATWIDQTHIAYECPFCWSKYKKNGQPYANATRTVHLHGSGGDTSNRVVHKVSHCTKTPNGAAGGVWITVSQATARR